MKYKLVLMSMAAALLFSVSGCTSAEDKLANKCCECLKAEKEENKRFRDCMGPEMYEELGTYDHNREKEGPFTEKVRKLCPDVGAKFSL